MGRRAYAAGFLLAVVGACVIGNSSPGQAFRYVIPTFPRDKPACIAMAAQFSGIIIDPGEARLDPVLAAGAKADEFGWTQERVVAELNEGIAALMARIPAGAAFGAKCLSRMSLARANILSIQLVVHHEPRCDRGPLPSPDQEERCYYKVDVHWFWCGADGCTYLYLTEAVVRFSIGGKPIDTRVDIRHEVSRLQQGIRDVR